MSLQFSVPAVEDALVDALKALPALSGVHIADGMGTETPAENDSIYIIRVRPLRLEPASQQGGQTEEYDLHLLASSYRPDSTLNVPADTDRRAAKARKWALLDAVRNLLASDNELGGACKHAELTEVPDAATNRTADGWLSDAIAIVHVRATSG